MAAQATPAARTVLNIAATLGAADAIAGAFRGTFLVGLPARTQAPPARTR